MLRCEKVIRYLFSLRENLSRNQVYQMCALIDIWYFNKCGITLVSKFYRKGIDFPYSITCKMVMGRLENNPNVNLDMREFHTVEIDLFNLVCSAVISHKRNKLSALFNEMFLQEISTPIKDLTLSDEMLEKLEMFLATKVYLSPIENKKPIQTIVLRDLPEKLPVYVNGNTGKVVDGYLTNPLTKSKIPIVSMSRKFREKMTIKNIPPEGGLDDELTYPIRPPQ